MVRISKTILVQSCYMLLPGALIYAIMKPGQKTEEEFERELREKRDAAPRLRARARATGALRRRYGAQIRKQAGHRDALQKHFDIMKDKDAPGAKAQEERRARRVRRVFRRARARAPHRVLAGWRPSSTTAARPS